MTTIVDGTTGITFPSTIGGTSAVQQYSSKILQVVQTQLTNLQSFSTSPTYSWVNVTGASVSITPTSATSKILVQYSCMAQTLTPQPYFATYTRITRNGTAVGVGTGTPFQTGTFTSAMSAQYVASSVSQVFLDSPGTTSTLTYQLQIAGENSPTVVGGSYGSYSNNSPYPNAPTSIIVMEIAA